MLANRNISQFTKKKGLVHLHWRDIVIDPWKMCVEMACRRVVRTFLELILGVHGLLVLVLFFFLLLLFFLGLFSSLLFGSGLLLGLLFLSLRLLVDREKLPVSYDILK